MQFLLRVCALAAVFASWDFPFEVSKSGNVGRKKDLPLATVLRYFQAQEFRAELQKFGVIGFDRFGRFAQPVTKPYARRHVYKVRPNAYFTHCLAVQINPLP